MPKCSALTRTKAGQVIGSVSTMLSRIYPVDYKASPAQQNVSSITFAGTVLGTLVFGVSSDSFDVGLESLVHQRRPSELIQSWWTSSCR